MIMDRIVRCSILWVCALALAAAPVAAQGGGDAKQRKQA